MAIDYSYLVQGKELKGDYLVQVCSGSPYVVAYFVNEGNLNVHREFRPMTDGKMDIKYIPFEELFYLNNVPGGREIIFEKLYIKDPLVREALDLPTIDEVPEFGYTKEDVKKVLLEGTDDEVLDMYDFGPERMAEITKSLLVELDNISYSRLQLLEKIFHWNNITRMIENWKDLEEEKPKQQTHGRRSLIKEEDKKEEKPISQRRANRRL